MLPLPPKEALYWDLVRLKAVALGSDGCTGVPDFYLDACYEHDIHWRTGFTLLGDPITYAEANTRFRRVIQSRSPFGRFSPMAWWRYWGVTWVSRMRMRRGQLPGCGFEPATPCPSTTQSPGTDARPDAPQSQ